MKEQTAMRQKVRAAKRDLTVATRELHKAQLEHLRALRSETRAIPVWVSPDSDQSGDAVHRAFQRYMRSASSLDFVAREYRMTIR